MLTLFLQSAHTLAVRRFPIALALLVVAATVAVAAPPFESRQRAPEGVARAYVQAVERGDLEAALATVDPVEREALRERVAWQLRNRYEIVTLVLGRPSVLDRVRGRPRDAAWATVMADVTTVTGERWRSTSMAPFVLRDGVWYLVRPLFA